MVNYRKAGFINKQLNLINEKDLDHIGALVKSLLIIQNSEYLGGEQKNVQNQEFLAEKGEKSMYEESCYNPIFGTTVIPT